MSGRGCPELLPELSIVLTRYPEEKTKHNKSYGGLLAHLHE